MADVDVGTMATSAAPEVVEYEAPWPLYGLAWSSRRNGHAPRVAVGSFVEEYRNQVEILEQHDTRLEVITRFEHPYPTTKIGWIPDQKASSPELVAMTGDFLRIWEVGDDNASRLKCVLNNVRCDGVVSRFSLDACGSRLWDRKIRLLPLWYDFSFLFPAAAN